MSKLTPPYDQKTAARKLGMKRDVLAKYEEEGILTAPANGEYTGEDIANALKVLGERKEKARTERYDKKVHRKNKIARREELKKKRAEEKAPAAAEPAKGEGDAGGGESAES